MYFLCLYSRQVLDAVFLLQWNKNSFVLKMLFKFWKWEWKSDFELFWSSEEQNSVKFWLDFNSKTLLWLKSETFPPFFSSYQSAAERRQEPLHSGFKAKE